MARHDGTIPQDPTWCSYCILSKEGPCENHRGPDGKPQMFDGYDAFEPTEYIQSLIGLRFLAWDSYLPIGPGGNSTRVWVCFGYDPRNGFWMRTVDDRGPTRETNISGRAIDRTWHRLHMTPGAWWLLEAIQELGRMPTEDEAKERRLMLDLATQTCRRFDLLTSDGTLNDAGRKALADHPSDRRTLMEYRL